MAESEQVRLRRFARDALAAISDGSASPRIGRQRAGEADALMKACLSWLRPRSVQGLGLGPKLVNGERTATPAIKVYVNYKRPLSKLAKPAPEFIRFNGYEIPVDVEAVGDVRLQSDFRRARRPVQAGYSIAHKTRADSGTIGGIVRSVQDPDRVFVLSSHHVLSPLQGSAGNVWQPSAEDGGVSASDIANYSRSIPIHFSASGFPNKADAALARLDAGIEYNPRIPSIGVPKGATGFIREGKTVRIVGRTSGFQIGQVEDTNAVMEFRYRTPNGIQRAGFHGLVRCSRYSSGGDSGALVLSQGGYAIGLHMAGSSTHSFFCPLVPILRDLDVDLIPQSGTVPQHRDFTNEAEINTGLGVDPTLLSPHRRFAHSIRWRLTQLGLEVDGVLEGTTGPLVTIPKIWQDFGVAIRQSANNFGIPVELILACIATETIGDATAVRQESGYVSDAQTPHRVSAGLMQTLISTARETLGDATLDRSWLLDPSNSIKAGTAYIAQQSGLTLLDPPLVAAAYNAGGVYENTSSNNRWRLRQFPINTGKHLDRYTAWFNDCFRMFNQNGIGADCPSFFRMLNA